MSRKPVKAGVTDHQGPGDQCIHGLPGAQATGGGRLRGRVEPQATRGAGGAADFRRREGGQTDCLGVFQASQGTCTLDHAVVGEQGGGTPHCGSRQRQHDRADAQKNTLKPHRRQQWVIPPEANSAFVAAMEDVLAERFEWHYTPKHGSWLDLAESELGVLSSQCLDRRIPDKPTLIDEIAAWEHDRNANHAKANWHFTTPTARIKLKHLYPSI